MTQPHNSLRTQEALVSSIKRAMSSWWERETDACDMLRYVGHVAARRPQRQLALAPLACARSCDHLLGPWKEEVVALLDQREAWCREASTVNPERLRARLWTLCFESTFTDESMSAFPSQAMADAASYAIASGAYALSPDPSDYHEAARWAARALASAESKGGDERVHLAVLAEKIRASLPLVPLKGDIP